MTTVKAICPACGCVELTSDQVVARANPALTSGSYSFACPRCALLVTHPADVITLRLLVAGGIAIQVGPRFDAPALTRDDELDLHQALAEPDWLTKLIRAPRLPAGGTR